MLKCEGNEEFINLDNLDDSVDDFLSNKLNNLTEIKEKVFEIREKSQQINDTILNEEIDTQNLPASPPFTKISAIKMFSAPTKNSSTPLRLKKQESETASEENENKTAILARKDHTKSFLPRIKKRQK
jgi:hypothetical protein